MRIDNVKVFLGKDEIKGYPCGIFDDVVVGFLEAWSNAIRKDAEARRYSDIMTFAFWIRRGSINQFKELAVINNDRYVRYGRGIVFHVSPSNIPVIFVYSWVFGLLSGNSNIVKVSSKEFAQTQILCRIANEVISNNPDYRTILDNNVIITYERSRDDLTGFFVENCDAKVIWGGDETINRIRQFKSKPRCVDLLFADRYSFSIISTDAVLNIDETELANLTHRFYSDTYLIDQNACSSPSLIFWLGANVKDAKNRFFSALKKEEKNYDLSDIIVSNKYLHSCEVACDNDVTIERYGNFIYDYNLQSKTDIIYCKGTCGEFFSIEISDINDIAGYINSEKIQTCSVYGVDKTSLISVIEKNEIKGVDRVVEIGQALDIGVIWDGYNVLGLLSRIIEIR